jgi:hypothetical protein
MNRPFNGGGKPPLGGVANLPWERPGGGNEQGTGNFALKYYNYCLVNYYDLN